MLHHPSEFYIKYLMTLDDPNAAKDDWISYMVTSTDLPQPDADFLKIIRGRLEGNKPSDLRLADRYHRTSVKFLRDEGIWSLHNPDEATRLAMATLKNHKTRPIIEQLLLGKLQAKDIAKKVNSRFGEFITAPAVDSYAHYFWNVSLLTIEEWGKLLEQHDSQRARIIPILRVGPAMALHVSGFHQSIESKTMLKEMQEAIYFDFREWKTRPLSIDKTRALSGLSKAACFIDTQLSQAESALKDSLRAFEQFRMKHSELEVIDVKELAPAGNVSMSGVKLLDAAPQGVEK